VNQNLGPTESEWERKTLPKVARILEAFVKNNPRMFKPKRRRATKGAGR
jgi:hypothetical protein